MSIGSSIFKKSMFGKPRYKYLSEIVSISSPQSALTSVIKLRQEYFGTESESKQKRVIRSMVLAQNRAEASSNRRNISERERNEMRIVSRIYRDAVADLPRRR